MVLVYSLTVVFDTEIFVLNADDAVAVMITEEVAWEVIVVGVVVVEISAKKIV